jgi:hypothetical protein
VRGDEESGAGAKEEGSKESGRGKFKKIDA